MAGPQSIDNETEPATVGHCAWNTITYTSLHSKVKTASNHYQNQCVECRVVDATLLEELMETNITFTIPLE